VIPRAAAKFSAFLPAIPSSSDLAEFYDSAVTDGHGHISSAASQQNLPDDIVFINNPCFMS
jgi:hypothetical protein